MNQALCHTLRKTPQGAYGLVRTGSSYRGEHRPVLQGKLYKVCTGSLSAHVLGRPPYRAGSTQERCWQVGEGTSGEPRERDVWEGEKGEASAGAEEGREDAGQAALQSCVLG